MSNYDLTYEGSEVQSILDTGEKLREGGYILMGGATPSTLPGTPTKRVAYIGGPGSYSNFGTTTVVPSGSIGVFKYTGSAWSNEVIACTVPISTSVEDSDASVPTGKAVKTAVDAVSGAVSDEATAREDADGALQTAINNLGTKLAEGYIYVGIATPTTNPGTPAGKVLYIATAAGTYTNFLNGSSQALVLTQGINILKYNGSTWSVEQVWGVDDAPTPSSNNLVKSGGVFNDIMTNGSAFDLTAYNNGTTYTDLDAALTALNALPAAYKKGGMSLKFVLTSDNKYVQFRLMSDTFNTNPANWQGVDAEPIDDSKNIVESQGLYNNIYNGIQNNLDFTYLNIWLDSGASRRRDLYEKALIFCAVVPDEAHKDIDFVINALDYGNRYASDTFCLWIKSRAESGNIHIIQLQTTAADIEKYPIQSFVKTENGCTLYCIVNLKVLADYGASLVWGREANKEVIVNKIADNDLRIMGWKMYASDVITTATSALTKANNALELLNPKPVLYHATSSANTILASSVLDMYVEVSNDTIWDGTHTFTKDGTELSYSGAFKMTFAIMYANKLTVFLASGNSFIASWALCDVEKNTDTIVIKDNICYQRNVIQGLKMDGNTVSITIHSVINWDNYSAVTGVVYNNTFNNDVVKEFHYGSLSELVLAKKADEKVENVFKDINLGVSGDSITAGNQWSYYVYNILKMHNHHNSGVGSSTYAKRNIEYDGVTYSTQDFDDPNFAGVSSGYGPIPDAEEAQKRANNCSIIHIQQFIADVTAGNYPIPDIFCFAYGTNDDTDDGVDDAIASGRNYPSGNNLFTLAGAMKWCVQKIKETYPQCQIFVLLPIQRYLGGNSNNLIKIEQIKAIASAMSIHVIDMFNNCGISSIMENGEGPYLRDGLHPNTTGQKLMGGYAATQIKDNYFFSILK